MTPTIQARAEASRVGMKSYAIELVRFFKQQQGKRSGWRIAYAKTEQGRFWWAEIPQTILQKRAALLADARALTPDAAADGTKKETL